MKNGLYEIRLAFFNLAIQGVGLSLFWVFSDLYITGPTTFAAQLCSLSATVVSVLHRVGC
jgi:hypothetical protein